MTRTPRFDGRVWDTLGERGNLLAGEGWRYTPHGQVRHKTRSDWASVCGLDRYEEDWHGTGSQDEYERLGWLPRCSRCVALGAR